MVETERLILRRFNKDDWQDLYEYLSDEAVVRYEPYGVFTEEECKQAAISRANQEFFWAICLKGSGEAGVVGRAGSAESVGADGSAGSAAGKLIGNIYFQQQNPPEFMCWSLGYVLSPRYQGQGYATEGCQAILEHGFTKMCVVLRRCATPKTPPPGTCSKDWVYAGKGTSSNISSSSATRKVTRFGQIRFCMQY